MEAGTIFEQHFNLMLLSELAETTCHSKHAEEALYSLETRARNV